MVSVIVRLMISKLFLRTIIHFLNKPGVQICIILALVTRSYSSYRKREHSVQKFAMK